MEVQIVSVMLEALGLASILMTFIRHADRIKIACMTGGLRFAIAFDGKHVWKNAAYYPYYQMNRLAREGMSLLPAVDGRTFDTEQFAPQRVLPVSRLRKCAGYRMCCRSS